jgi:hypothetical protein
MLMKINREPVSQICPVLAQNAICEKWGWRGTQPKHFGKNRAIILPNLGAALKFMLYFAPRRRLT